MRQQIKYIAIYLCVLGVLVTSLLNLAQGKTLSTSNYSTHGATRLHSPLALQQILAPIALYPDSVLSHIFVASTYPLQVVQGARWRAKHEHYSAQQIQYYTADKHWDPSVVALLKVTPLIQRLSQDLDWLQTLGQAFLHQQAQVLAEVQTLRSQAYQHGQLQANHYIDLHHHHGQIVIQSRFPNIVYIPAYDVNNVFGTKRYGRHSPYHWTAPYSDKYSRRIIWVKHRIVNTRFHFATVFWDHGYVGIHRHYKAKPYYQWHGYRHNRQKVRTSEYNKWRHQGYAKHRTPPNKPGYSKKHGQRIIKNNQGWESKSKQYRKHDYKKPVVVTQGYKKPKTKHWHDKKAAAHHSKGVKQTQSRSYKSSKPAKSHKHSQKHKSSQHTHKSAPWR